MKKNSSPPTRSRQAAPPAPRRLRRAVEDTQLTALKESEERWKFALEGAGDGVWDWQVPTSQVVFSRRWKAMLGYKEDEVDDTYAEWESRVHPDDLPGAMATLREHLEGRSPHYVNDFRMRCRDGSWKWIRARGLVTSRDKSGKPLRVIGTHTDISAEKAAKEREAANLRLIVEDAPLPAVLEALVCSVEAEHPALRCAVMLVEGGGTRFTVGAAPGMTAKQRRILEGLPAGENGPRHVLGMPVGWPSLALDATKQWMACWAEPVKGGSGRVHGMWICYFRDPRSPGAAEISAIRAAAQLTALAVERDERRRQIQESEARLARAMRGSSDGLWDWNIRTGEDYHSSRWNEMLGYNDDDLPKTEQAFFSLLHPEDVDRVQAALKAHFEGRQPYDVEIRLRTKDGGYRWIRSRGEAERDERGRPVRMAGSVTDITERKAAEFALRESEEKFRAVFEQAAVGVAVIDSNTGRFLSVNRRACDIARLTREEMTSATFMDITHPEDLQPDLDNMERLKRGEIRTFTMEKRYRHADGSITWISLTVSPMWAPGETPTRHIAVVQDITERKQVELGLRESEERFRVIFEQAAVGVAVIDSNTGRYLRVNRRHCEITGLTPEEILSRTFVNITHPDDRAQDERNMVLLRSGAVRSLYVEKRYVQPDGSIKWVNVTVSAMWPPGAPATYHIAVAEDITERRRAAEALQESEAKFRTLFENAGDAIFLLEGDRFTDCNARTLEMFGCRERAQIVGHPPYEFSPPTQAGGMDSRTLALEKINAALAGRPQFFEWMHTKLDGTPFPAEVTLNRIFISGRPVLQSFVRDITERKRLEREIVDAGEREQQRLGGELHDDLCQRLASLKLKMEFIANRLEELKMAEAPQARLLWRQLSDVTSDARSMAKGLAPITPDPEGLINALATLVPAVEALHEVPCFFDCRGLVLVENRAVASHLYRIAQELMNNAARHGQAERIDVRLLTGAGHVRLEVEHDGVTFRGHPPAGPGLGLRIMRFRADAIGSTVQFLPRRDGKPGTLALCQVPQSVCNPAVGHPASSPADEAGDWRL